MNSLFSKKIQFLFFSSLLIFGIIIIIAINNPYNILKKEASRIDLNQEEQQAKAKIIKHETPLEVLDIIFTDINNNKNTLRQFVTNNKDKTIIVNLWSQACKPCLQELIIFEELQEINHEDIIIMPISIDNIDASLIQTFYQKIGISNLKIYKDYQNSSFKANGSLIVPMSFIIKNQQEVARIIGFVDWFSPEIIELYK